MNGLEPSTVAGAVPPGSMRQLAILFSPPEKRALLEALHVVEHEILGSARHTSHEVAHNRLQWWRAEVDRLVNGVPQHPATRALLPLRHAPNADLGTLHEMLVAADMDLAQLTYDSNAQLIAYTRRASGITQQFAARWLAAPAEPTQRSLDSALRFGSAVRQVEVIRDLRQDVLHGRLYVPLDELERSGLTVEDLRAPATPQALRALLDTWHERLRRDLERALSGFDAAERATLRHGYVLARLHSRLLHRLRGRGYDVASARVELGPLERLWVAWRAARKTV